MFCSGQELSDWSFRAEKQIEKLSVPNQHAFCRWMCKMLLSALESSDISERFMFDDIVACAENLIRGDALTGLERVIDDRLTDEEGVSFRYVDFIRNILDFGVHPYRNHFDYALLLRCSVRSLATFVNSDHLDYHAVEAMHQIDQTIERLASEQ